MIIAIIFINKYVVRLYYFLGGAMIEKEYWVQGLRLTQVRASVGRNTAVVINHT